MTEQTPPPEMVETVDIAELKTVLLEMRRTVRDLSINTRVLALGSDRMAPVFFRDSVITTHVPYADFDEGQRRLVIQARHEDDLSFFQLAEHGIVAPGRSLVVVGGYLGCSTVALAQIAEPDAVHVFEPQNCLQEALRKTLDANGLEAAQIHRSVVSEAGAAMALGTQTATKLAETVFVARDGGGYPATALDAEDLGDVGLLHLCFSGTKIPALRGAVETIKRCSPVILCDKSGRDLKEIETFLGDLGYAHQAVGPRLFLYVREAG